MRSTERRPHWPAAREGTMTVYKNEERIGVMVTGLSGDFCWAAELSCWNEHSTTLVRIESAPIPEPAAGAAAQ